MQRRREDGFPPPLIFPVFSGRVEKGQARVQGFPKNKKQVASAHFKR